MKKWHWVSIIATVCFLAGCTSLNKKCDYIPSGGCWRDGRECVKDTKDIDLVPCRNTWSCGFNVPFHDQ
jgi:hypothetical protein